MIFTLFLRTVSRVNRFPLLLLAIAMAPHAPASTIASAGLFDSRQNYRFAYTLGGNPIPQNQAILEGTSGQIEFQIINDQTFDVKITAIDDPVLTQLLASPEYQDNDAGNPGKRDEVLNPQRIGGICGVGSILRSNHSCSVVIGFNTFDGRVPLDPDKDFGLWQIEELVTVIDFPAQKSEGLYARQAQIAVLDSGVSSPFPTPEPSSIGLMVLGLAGMSGVFAFKSLRRPTASENLSKVMLSSVICVNRTEVRRIALTLRQNTLDHNS